MERWTEEEIKNKDLMAPCGLYCGVCGVYIVTRDGNEKFKTIMVNLYVMKPEDTECIGCMQPDPPKKIYDYCRICAIRDCVKSKGYYSCHQCEEWPCGMIENFGLATGARVMTRTILIWLIFCLVRELEALSAPSPVQHPSDPGSRAVLWSEDRWLHPIA